MTSNEEDQERLYGRIPDNVLSPARRYQSDSEISRPARSFLKHIHDYSTYSVPELQNSWGYTIIRTAYGPGTDEQYARALELIKGWIQWGIDREAHHTSENLQRDKDMEASYKAFRDIFGSAPQHQQSNSPFPEFPPTNLSIQPDPVPTSELEKRLCLDEILDPVLEGAGLEMVRDRFRAWIDTKYVWGQHRFGGPRYSRNVRFRTCIWLDKETLDQLSTAPDVPRIHDLYGYKVKQHMAADIHDPVHLSYKLGSKHWVKIVESYPPPETDKDGFPHSEWARLWLRNLFCFWYERLADHYDPSYFNLGVVHIPQEGPEAYYFEPEFRVCSSWAAEEKTVEALLAEIKDNVEKIRNFQTAESGEPGNG